MTGHFIKYLCACQTRNGTRLSKSGYYSKRAGLYHLYRIYGKQQTKFFQEDLRQLFKGFLRTVAVELQNGEGRITTGKIPLSFELYTEICRWMQQDNSPSGKFAHLFFVLSWNLACRSSNTRTIHFHHLGWMQDAMQIYFCHMKNDQTGDRPRDPRHVYANPFNPFVCPILSMLSYLLVTPPTSDTCLFPGANQYNRFNKYLNKLLNEKREYIMTTYGVNVDDIGAHSARKGASTYMTSGCVNGPSQQAVNIRCGWKTVGVTDTYCRYAAAGDQLCGRVASGLPLFSYRFGVLPPFFQLENEEDEAVLNRLIKTLFPDLAIELWPIVKHGIASLALREDFLRQNLSANNCLFQSAIFWNEDYQYLKGKAKLEIGVDDRELEIDQVRVGSGTVVTGIPSHVVVLASQRNLVLQQRQMIANNNALPGIVETAVTNTTRAPRNEFQNAMQSLTSLSQNLIDKLENLDIRPREQAEDEPTDTADPVVDIQDPEPPRMQIDLHYHNGQFIRIDPTFVFPKQCSLRDIFFRYHLYDRIERIPPLRLLDSASVKHIKRGKQTLTDMRLLMKVLEAEAMRQGLSMPISTQQEASELFERIKDAIYKYDTKSKRKETLKWATWVKKVRAGTRETLFRI